ncbi:MAG: CDP-alcohol phosphatidyltransferase family protein [Pedococcus sp.]
MVSVPNAITVVRTVVAMALAVWAGYTVSVPMLVAAYLVYWFGDMADGQAARRMNQETRLGAVFDIVCDRASTMVVAAAFLRIDPDSTPAIGIFLFQFCVVDTMLSLSFLAFDIVSPNYFYRVDRAIYRMNWTHPAKALNNSLVVLLCLADLVWPGVLAALAVLGVKVWSIARLLLATRGASRRGELTPAGDSTLVP